MLRRIIFCFILFLSLATNIFAQENLTTQEKQFEATINKVVENKTITVFGTKQKYQKLEVITDSGKKIIIENGGLQSSSTQLYEEDDRVIVSQVTLPDKSFQYFVLDYVRRDSLYVLGILFILCTIVVARKKGLTSIIGLVYSFGVLFKIILPAISSGVNPILIALIGGVLIIPVNFYLSHGFNRKTHTAIISTVIVLILTSALAHFFIEGARLTGFASEDANFLEINSKGTINIKGLMLAGIIIGLFGILDDITISQAAIVFALKETSPHLSMRQVYSKAMNIGRDHIGSLVNTLILVYAGAALPFMLLFLQQGESFTTVINYEIIAEEIVRTLCASIGLIIAVPVTTFLASIQHE